MNRSLVLGLPLLLALVTGAVWWVHKPLIRASLYDLIGPAAETIPAFVREVSATEIAFVVTSTDGEKARIAARDLAQKHPISEALKDTTLDFLRKNRNGLVTPETAAMLTTATGRTQAARRAKRRLYSSPLPPLLGYADDPFGLTEDFLATLLPKSSQTTAEGYPVLVTNGLTHILLRTRLGSEASAGLEETIAAIEDLKREASQYSDSNGPEVSVALAGAPVHTAIAASRCKREISALTWLSLSVIVTLSFFVFRTLRWLPLLLGSLAVSALAGILAFGIFFRSIHVMTLVIGTTVLGLVIDYSFHWLLSPTTEKKTVLRGLLVSFLTTEISLIPLMLSTIPVLRQSATFLGVGLAAALGYVLMAYPRDVAERSKNLSTRHALCLPSKGRLVLMALGVAVLSGLFRITIKTDISALYRPPAELATAEKTRALFNTFDFSVFPTYEERLKTAAHVSSLYTEHGAEMAKTLGLKTLRPPPLPRKFLLRPQIFIEQMFTHWTSEAFGRLGLSIAVLIVLLLSFCRRQALRLILPPVSAILLVSGILGWLGISLNLFHLLAAFLLLGMGIDYAVFLSTGNSAAFKPAFCSLLTSVVGFGALAFVSFPVVQSFGVVLGLGLPLAFILAYVWNFWYTSAL